MAKDKQLPDQPETMEDYMLRQLKKTVILKDGNTLKDPHDGHELTAEVRAPFTQGGGLRRKLPIPNPRLHRAVVTTTAAATTAANWKADP